MPLATAMMSGSIPSRWWMREQLAGAAHARLHLVEDQQDAMLVAQLRASPAGIGRHRADTALALHRLDEHAGVSGADGRLERVMVAEGEVLEPWRAGPKPSR
jgi:hypothetical protein